MIKLFLKVMILFECIGKTLKRALWMAGVMRRTEYHMRAIKKMSKRSMIHILKSVKSICRSKKIKYKKHSVDIFNKICELSIKGYEIKDCLGMVEKSIFVCKDGSIAWVGLEDCLEFDVPSYSPGKFGKGAVVGGVIGNV